MRRLLSLGLLGFSLVALMGCAASTSEVDEEEVVDAESAAVKAFVAKGTGYYPDGSRLEGGYVDRRGKPLHTLQAFLAGDAPYVSVAMDSRAFKYGTKLRIQELEDKYGQRIEFRVVDTGGAFAGKGRSRMDVCVKNRAASLDRTINGSLHATVVPSDQ